jgi:DNA-binding SARP family transcriptional activator/TolB-like protein/Tfp pilus assembly protein PilF
MRRDQENPRTYLTIRLFGGMSIQDSRGASYFPRSRKARAVVAILALAAPRPMQRVQITSLLWSQRENEQARASLRQAVHELQGSLGKTWNRLLLAERHSLALDLRGVAVDALDSLRPGAPETGLLTLFQGGFLEDLRGLDPAFDDWLARERRRLGSLACIGASNYLRDHHGGGETIAVARALLRLDPLNQGAWRALIQAHIDAADRAAARFAFEQWREARGVPKDQPPPPDMAAFLSRIRAHPAGDASDWPIGASTGALPNGIEPNGVVPDRIAPNQPGADRIIQAPPGTGSNAGRRRTDTLSERTSLRIGVREMRVIGPNVDPALPVGLAEEITTALSRFRWISCVPGSSLAAIAGETGEAGLRWHDHDIDLILDGTIQRTGPRSGDQIRVSAQLLDLRADGAVIWANGFDQARADTLAIQDRVAGLIVAQMDPVLLMREGDRASARARHTASARDLVSQAVPAIYRLDRMAFHAAGDLLEAALRTEPAYPEALAWFAYWHLFLIGQGWSGDPAAATRRAAELADAAVSLDPNDARALTLSGHVRGFLMKRPSDAMVLHDRAISLNPNLAIAWCFSGFAMSYSGDQDRALARMRQAIQLSPSDPHQFFFQAAIIMPHLLRGEYREAAVAGRTAIELNPWFSSAFKGYLAVLGHLGCRGKAARVISRLLTLEPGFTVRDAVSRSPMRVAADLERYAEGLRLAGLPEG